MSLHIESLTLDKFRGYSHFTLENLGQLTIIAGPNAVGKTNIVEGVQLVTAAESFRRPSWDELVSWGQDFACVQAHLSDGVRSIEHRLLVQEGKRTYEVNGKKKNASSVRGVLPAVLFIPDDLQTIKAASSVRRNCLDGMAVQLSKSYAAVKKEYQQVLRQRNMLLKEELGAGPLFDSWTESLVVHGARLSVNRQRLFKRLATHMKRIYRQIVPHEQLEIAYISSWQRFDAEGRQQGDLPAPPPPDAEDETSIGYVQAQLEKAVSSLAAVERQRKVSLVGPHKDEIAFFINGKNARTYASQGQQRTLVLVLKLAEVELVNEILGQEPVLLLDDVMSELDAAHRNALTLFIEQSAQTLVTTTNLGYFSEEMVERAHVVNVPIEGTRY